MKRYILNHRCSVEEKQNECFKKDKKLTNKKSTENESLTTDESLTTEPYSFLKRCYNSS